jgi:hypothetical protein
VNNKITLGSFNLTTFAVGRRLVLTNTSVSVFLRLFCAMLC